MKSRRISGEIRYSIAAGDLSTDLVGVNAKTPAQLRLSGRLVAVPPQFSSTRTLSTSNPFPLGEKPR
jgi:hypothetical protein